MIVCHCVGASDRTIREVIRAGATTVAEIARCTGAGRCCESCREEIGEILLTAGASRTACPRRTSTSMACAEVP
ncbi:MAG TPA: (2Fe-2S)-binding protein [Candidatus Binatia bacterium]|nr:(2Fe-2S)-binding protein [Candidatus Binatia bacterium]